MLKQFTFLTVATIGCTLGIGCATAVNDTGGGTFDVGGSDTTTGFDSSAADVAGDSGRPGDSSTSTDSRPGVDAGGDTRADTLVATDGGIDTGATDTFVATDTAVTDSGVDTGTDAGGDAGAVGRVLVYNDVVDDFFGLPAPDTLADDAVVALGGTVTLANTTNFNTLFDGGGFSVVVIDAPYSALPTGADTRIVTWITGGNRIVYTHWSLNSQTTIASALQVTPVTYTTWRNVHRDLAATDNLFAGKQAVPSPITGVADLVDNGDSLTTTGAGGFLAARLDSASGVGGIAVTRSGKAIVNGFAPFNCKTADTDSDGIKDMRELWENEILYVLAH